ncbi:TPA: fimbrial protein [Escherichia coli]|nr:fimbrial protein [Escherichia coli]HDV2370962.1 fimbrial protein [Escherichia coli]HEK5737715.1 fimbrial protein [Escherichia coli]
MIKIAPYKFAILTGVLLCPDVLATDINVDFTATVKATTCNITLTGNNVTNNGNDGYTLKIPKMGLDQIVKKTTNAQADFTLVASGCSSGISYIDTTITGAESGSSPRLLIPLSGDTSSTTTYIGMGFKKRGAEDTTFLKPNSAEKIRWSATEISTTGLEMTVALRETSPGEGKPGDFHAQATFNFTYE